jgi:SAM-dependent methyltransferase
MTGPATGPATAGDFDRKFAADADPWDYRGSAYERRKRAVTVAALPRERYRLAWEPACAIGVLTAELARRADRVVATDASPRAIALAREGLPDDVTDRVELAVAELPAIPAIPRHAADLVVLSEILYYLDDDARSRTLAAAHDVLEPGGDLVAVHWLPRADDAHTSGGPVHAWLRSLPTWTPLVRHDDESFVLDVLRRV